MSKKILMLDLDDVSNNFGDVLLYKYNNDFNDKLTKEDIKSWNIKNYVKPEARDVLFDYLVKDNFFQNLDIQPNAKEVTQWLQKYYDIHIITAYTPFACIDKALWIEKYLPHIDIKTNLGFLNEKGLIKADSIIDDAPHNILDFIKTNPTGIPIVFDKPWNRKLDEIKNKNGFNFIRVKDWLEIKEVFKEIIKQDSL